MGQRQDKAICVYCASQPGTDPRFRDTAEQLGDAIGKAGLNFVYGGGTNGLMGIAARAAKQAGSRITGVIPQFLLDREAARDELGFIDNLVVTPNMHERKAKMFEYADAFVTLPGGIGTLEEVIEIMTWGQLGRHDKPIAFVNPVAAHGAGFWDPLMALFEEMSAHGFIHTADRVKPIIHAEPQAVISNIRDKWVKQEATSKP